jgi:hypothetical protein
VACTDFVRRLTVLWLRDCLNFILPLSIKSPARLLVVSFIKSNGLSSQTETEHARYSVEQQEYFLDIMLDSATFPVNV